MRMEAAMGIRPGYVQTVLGPIAAAQAGPMLPHEHLLWDPVGDAASPCAAASERAKWDTDISLDNYYDVRRNYAHYKRPQQLLSVSDAIEEVAGFRQAGGGCIVDATPAGVGRDPEGLAAIARATGVHVIMGSGFYVAASHPLEVREASEDQLADWITRDITVGVGTTGVRAGFIGEIGLSWPVLPDEEKVLRAAAAAQQRTGAALMVHPGRDPQAPRHAASIVAAAGGDVSRLIVAHMERTMFSLEEFADLAETGCYLEFDLFGIESSFYPWSPIDMPNDAIRIDYIIGLAKLGYAGQVLVSQDIDMKVRLQKYGGEGYSHILRNVLPLMQRKGMSETEIDELVGANPARAYAGSDRQLARRSGK
jgi:phosphotriesterase-related protein